MPHQAMSCDDVGEFQAGVEVADPQRVVLATVDVGAPRQQLLVVADVERVDREEVVPLGLEVLVEQDLRGGVVGGPSAAVDGVVATLLGARRVPPLAVLDRRGQVGLLDARLDLAEDRLDEVVVIGEPRIGVRVLGLEVGDGVGVVAVAQPRPRILDAAGRAVPVMFDLLGDVVRARRTQYPVVSIRRPPGYRR